MPSQIKTTTTKPSEQKPSKNKPSKNKPSKNKPSKNKSSSSSLEITTFWQDPKPETKQNTNTLNTFESNRKEITQIQFDRIIEEILNDLKSMSWDNCVAKYETRNEKNIFPNIEREYS
ncbi:hypothetical protein [Candidatus Phytoplasma asteris]|uniref:Uncharacterized protein n=1 Tax=Rapeseed phyllody phytoplasma TaxID=2490543 RepID=A0A859I8W8_9MOLU|nr:MAG: hypothetical protein RP166_0030 [Rapeseed phyllody phytoplasma]